MPYFTWKLELVSNILWMVVWKIPPRKMPLPEKYPLENLTLESFPPENFLQEKLLLSPMNCFVDFFLISNFYFYGNFRRQVKSIFIQFTFLIINNNLFIIFCCCCCCLFNLFLFIFNFQLWHIIYRIWNYLYKFMETLIQLQTFDAVINCWCYDYMNFWSNTFVS